MTATAEKARYFLERSVPELREFERKKIFNSDEITSIAKKRSDFEHKINARGSTPADYAQYAEFEINVDSLRRKRVKRMGIKSTAHNGQRRIYFVFDRGTRKFPGDIGLWMQTIEYARRQKAYKKLMQLFTNVLRLHPTKSELWIYAAQFAIDENGDMTEARSYMQRGLRFCKPDRNIWLEFVRLELVYMAKINMRRKILGIDGHGSGAAEILDHETDDSMLKLPTITAEDIDPHLDKNHDIDPLVLQNLDSTPVMTGAIPQAIFDSSMKHFEHDAMLAKKFFDLFATFSDIPVSEMLLDHLIESLHAQDSRSWPLQACFISRPMIGVLPSQPEFPSALRNTINRARGALSRSGQIPELAEWYRTWLKQKVNKEMDSALQRVILSHLQTIDEDHH